MRTCRGKQRQQIWQTGGQGRRQTERLQLYCRVVRVPHEAQQLSDQCQIRSDHLIQSGEQPCLTDHHISKGTKGAGFDPKRCRLFLASGFLSYFAVSCLFCHCLLWVQDLCALCIYVPMEVHHIQSSFKASSKAPVKQGCIHAAIATA